MNVTSFPQRSQDAANIVRVLIRRAACPHSPGGTSATPCELRAIADAAEDSYALSAATNHGHKVAQAAFRANDETLIELVTVRNAVVALAPEHPIPLEAA